MAQKSYPDCTWRAAVEDVTHDTKLPLASLGKEGEEPSERRHGNLVLRDVPATAKEDDGAPGDGLPEAIGVCGVDQAIHAAQRINVAMRRIASRSTEAG
jgi:hypothetical protein